MSAFTNAWQVEAAKACRHCPECEEVLRLQCGRLTRQWFWVHPGTARCLFADVGSKVFFPSREAALSAEQIFKGGA